MGTLKLLDCTLRDGGYINDWRFGAEAAADIKCKLEQTGAEFIELGFLRNEPYQSNRTVFRSMEQVKTFIGEKVSGINYTVMAEVSNPFPLDMLAPCDNESADAIRVIVWKRMLQEGFKYCKGIVEKGYRICVQPARVSQYSDEEFDGMIKLFNQLDPMAIYIVDSWGTMYADELLHYLELANHSLRPQIAVGYHGHNNMMQAFDVARAFADKSLQMDRDIIIDASIYGIGRGAGNLNLELFAKYMNDQAEGNYNLPPMLEIFDQYIEPIYKRHGWGFSMPYFISAKYNCNPNFASYYAQKKTLSAVQVEKIISSMPAEDRIIFSEDRAEKAMTAALGNGAKQ